MAARAAAARLHAVTLVRSQIGQNKSVRATLKALGLTRVNKTRILPNNETVNGMLRACLPCVEVTPVRFAPDSHMAAEQANSIQVGDRTVFISHDWVVHGITEEELAAFDPEEIREKHYATHSNN